jgi:hypothetical protein
MRYLIIALTLLGSLAIGTNAFAAGENSGSTGEHNGWWSTNCGNDPVPDYKGNEC